MSVTDVPQLAFFISPLPSLYFLPVLYAKTSEVAGSVEVTARVVGGRGGFGRARPSGGPAAPAGGSIGPGELRRS